MMKNSSNHQSSFFVSIKTDLTRRLKKVKTNFKKSREIELLQNFKRDV